MHDEPLLTILMPLKEYQPTFLKKSIQSVLDQTCPDWELLIIVERRTRNALANLLAATLQHPSIGMIVNEGRRLGGALNTGMRKAASDFVAILFADDLWARDAVAVLREAIGQNPKADFFHSSRIIIDETDRPISSVHHSRASFQLPDFIEASPVKHLLCWRREMGLAVGGIDESHNHGPDDYDFPWTMAEAGAFFHPLKEPLYLYRDHREGYRLTTHVPLSSQKWALRRILKKHGIDSQRIRARIAAAESSYLQQCLFATHEDRRRKTKRGCDSRLGWRDVYR